MKKKVFSVLIALVLGTSLLLAACAAPAPAPAPVPAPAPAPVPAPAPAPVPAPAPAAAEKPIVWRVNTSFTPVGLIADQLEWFKKSVEQRSGGRLIFEIYYSSALGFDRAEALPVLRDGLVEINELADNDEVSLPLIALPSLPFLFESWVPKNYWDATVFNPILEEELEKNWNCKILALNPNWPPVYFYSKKPLRTVEDFKDVKVRCWAGIIVDTLKYMGTAPFVIDTADMYTALQRGMIDTAVTAPTTVYEFKMYELLDYTTVIPIMLSTQYKAVNLDAFNALPKDLQDIVVLAGHDATHRYAYKASLDGVGALKVLEKQGMETIYPEPGVIEQFKKMLKPLYVAYDARSKDPRITALLKDLGALD